ncbi:MFS transporter [Georgenia halophila]|uniref:MFS transporter n=1 Tax=Georgenia halophila TaxID=620889 RepID=A0ABP8L7K6_9MICO
MSPFKAPAPRRAALTVWGAALAAYVAAVAGRTSFGVVGLQAAERFDVSATALSLFSVLQLAVYAGAQVPVGALLDRVGSRTMLLGGGVVLALAHLLLAFAETFPAALAARVLVGLGDAATFVPVIRLLPAWFPAGRVPVLTQVTSLVGQAGQIISAVPFLGLVVARGWTTAFAALSCLGVVTIVTTLLLVRNRPRDAPAPARNQQRDVPLRAVLHEPGAWLGLSTHFVCLFPANTFLLLWGVPFLTAGQGVSAEAASLLLSLTALTGVVTGPVTGVLTGRHPLRRSWLVLGSVAACLVAWASVLLPATPRPLWQLALLAVTLGAMMSAAGIGFDFARTFVPPARFGTATGLVNVGGFSASLISIFLVGAILDLVGGPHTLADYRLALSSQVLLWVMGLTGVLVFRRAARRRMAERTGVVVPPVRQALARRRSRRRDAPQ